MAETTESSFLTVLEVRSPRSMFYQGWFGVRGFSFWFVDGCLLIVSSPGLLSGPTQSRSWGCELRVSLPLLMGIPVLSD